MSDSDDEKMKEAEQYRNEKLGIAEEEDAEDREVKSKIEKQKQAEREAFLREEEGVFREGTYVRVEITLEKRFSMLLTSS